VTENSPLKLQKKTPSFLNNGILKKIKTCKPGSVLRTEVQIICHLSGPAVTSRIKQPTHCDIQPALSLKRAVPGSQPTWPYSTQGLPRCTSLHKAWALTPRFHPYHTKAWRYNFCCTFREQ